MNEYNDLPIYRYLLMMNRDGFSEYDFYELSTKNTNIDLDCCKKYLEMLIKYNILTKVNDKIYFTMRDDNE